MAQASEKTVSLGCGTLILIALIVIIFGRGSDSRKLEERIDSLKTELRNGNSKASSISSDVHDLENQVDKLQKSIDGLKQAMEAQRGAIEGLREDVKKLRFPEVPKMPRPRGEDAVPPVER